MSPVADAYFMTFMDLTANVTPSDLEFPKTQGKK